MLGFKRFFLHSVAPLIFSLTGILLNSSASAQLYSVDPYDPYGRAYRPFAYPGAGYNPALPNATRFPQGPGGVTTANQFQGFLSDPGLDLFGRSSRYDASFRQYDESFGRTATPGEMADEKYFAARQKREQAMIRAMVERDPRKRDTMVREAEAEAKKAGSVLGPSVRRGASPSSVPSAPSLNSRSASAARSRSLASPGAPSPSARRAPGIPAAPPLSVGTSRVNTNAVERARTGSAARRPSDVLERSRRESREVPPNPPLPSTGDTGAPRN